MKPYILRNTDIHTGNLILVNPKYQYQEPEKQQMVTVTEQASHVQMDRQAAILLSELMQKIHGWSKLYQSAAGVLYRSSKASGMIPLRKAEWNLQKNL